MDCLDFLGDHLGGGFQRNEEKIRERLEKTVYVCPGCAALIKGLRPYYQHRGQCFDAVTWLILNKTVIPTKPPPDTARLVHVRSSRRVWTPH